MGVAIEASTFYIGSELALNQNTLVFTILLVLTIFSLLLTMSR